MGCDNDAHRECCPRQGDCGTVEERAAGSRFWMGEHFVRWQGQTCLDGRQIKQAVVLATGEVADPPACQINDHRDIPILPIQSQQDASQRKVLFASILLQDADDPQQFTTILSIARISIGGEPLLGVRQ